MGSLFSIYKPIFMSTFHNLENKGGQRNPHNPDLHVLLEYSLQYTPTLLKHIIILLVWASQTIANIHGTQNSVTVILG